MPNPPLAYTSNNHFDADRVDERLYVGSYQAATAADLGRFSLLVLCARDLQPTQAKLGFKGTILRPAFDDIAPLPTDQAVRALQASNVVAEHIQAGGRALVTCAAGLNRSALVAAFAMKRLHSTWTADQIIQTIRSTRSKDALCNPYFCWLVTTACSVDELAR